MTELSSAYFAELANQLIFISAFLGGFSATILGTLIASEDNTKIMKVLILLVSISAASFILTVLSMTKIILIHAPDSPFGNNQDLTSLPRVVGSLSFLMGMIALLLVISLSGWLKSKKLGKCTGLIGLISFFFMVFLFVS